jgi:hypothetical protein
MRDKSEIGGWLFVILLGIIFPPLGVVFLGAFIIGLILYLIGQLFVGVAKVAAPEKPLPTPQISPQRRNSRLIALYRGVDPSKVPVALRNFYAEVAEMSDEEYARLSDVFAEQNPVPNTIPSDWR